MNTKLTPLQIVARILSVLFMTLMIVYCLTLLFPLFWLVINSFKDGLIEYTQYSSLSLPKEWIFDNYTNVFDNLAYETYTAEGTIQHTFITMLINSLSYAIGTAIYSAVTITITAYAVGRYKFWLTKTLYVIGIYMMIIPFTTDGGISLLLKKNLGIYDNLWAWILTSGGCIFTGQYFFIMTNLFATQGKDYAEAASIDGANEWKIMTRICIPLAKPLIIVILTLSFISSWNTYGTFLYYLPSYSNLAMGMYNFQNMAPIKGKSTPEVLAGFVVIAVPITVLYLFAQKGIVQNLNIGGLKG
jgi:ABC-type glycerol-3-phosphate transport system permease component